MKAGASRLNGEVYAAAQRLVDPAPPGETGTELTGAQSVEAIADALLTVTTPANLTFAVKALSTMKIRRAKRVAVFVTFTDGSMVTLRIAESRLRQLHAQLTKVLNA
jgi:hypothetical protein